MYTHTGQVDCTTGTRCGGGECVTSDFSAAPIQLFNYQNNWGKKGERRGKEKQKINK